jgi:hypothetical protein
MKTRSERKKRLRALLPYGQLATRQSLRDGGFSNHQIDNLLKSESIVADAPGVYRLPDAPLSWESAVASLQRFQISVSVGGFTALQMAGLHHYVEMGSKETVTLLSQKPLPRWLSAVLPDVSFEQTRYSRLFTGLPADQDFWHLLSTARQPDTRLTTSQPELAWLEALSGVPDQLSFEHADYLGESLTTLSPRRLRRLLTLCHNIKVKRLFFWFAERHQHSWRKHLHLADFSLGTGKRVLANPGKLDRQFLITVPESMYGSG